jgi:ribosome-binding protein aMBF1 (putative translation factor)
MTTECRLLITLSYTAHFDNIYLFDIYHFLTYCGDRNALGSKSPKNFNKAGKKVAAAKMRPTKSSGTVTIQSGKRVTTFPASPKFVKAIREISKQLRIEPISTNLKDRDWLDPDEVFHELFGNTDKPSLLVQGYRAREGWTQKELAEKLGTDQPIISAIEHGRREIGKKLAQKLAKLFDTDYRIFL